MKRLLAISTMCVLLLAACSTPSSEEPATSAAPVSQPTAQSRSLSAAELPVSGGCWRIVYASNQDWSEVVQVTLTSPWDLVPGEPTELAVDRGITAELTTGANLSSFYCNDVMYGNEVVDSEITAGHGSVTVTIAEAFPEDEFGDGSLNIPIVVRIHELRFGDGEGSVTVSEMTIATSIGWLAG